MTEKRLVEGLFFEEYLRRNFEEEDAQFVSYSRKR